jgi:hypothetical protein
MNAPVTMLVDERRSVRRQCRHQIHVDAGGCSIFAAALVDISTAGFRAMVAGVVNVGALVTIYFAGDRKAEAIVVWQQEALIGCHFITPLNHPDVAAISRGFGLSPQGKPKFGHESVGTDSLCRQAEPPVS